MAPRDLPFFILSFTICISGGDGKPPRKIINGTEAGQIPYQVSIQSEENEVHFCGGSIIDEKHILTAAHCVFFYMQPVSGTRVLIGTNDRENLDKKNLYNVERIIGHEQYSPRDSWKHDIAILQLDRNITFNEYQRPILLPVNDTAEGTPVTVTGWGYTDPVPRKLKEFPRYSRKMSERVISNDQCQKMMTSMKIHEEHICAWAEGSSAVCKYDSGSPLVDGPYLVGITSFNEYCKPEYPDVYTRVYDYVSWIRKTIADSALYPVDNFDIRR